jgi:2-polyprenyl-3-methyl-5-hydroxy-6-metoxy-1,4-benzoquinol methylase
MIESPMIESLASSSGESPIDAKHLSAVARSMYTDGPLFRRKLQHWRPYICPFERLVGYVKDGSQVLDVGCGGGLLLSLLAGLGCQFEGVGFDVSAGAIDAASRMARRAATISPNARLSFIRLDFDAAWPAEKVDVVFLIDVLHHVPPASQRAFLERVISKVKPSGIFVYKDMCLRPWWKAQANRLHDLVIARESISYVPVETVEQWARLQGMRVIAREDLSRFWYGHELRVMKFQDS